MSFFVIDLLHQSCKVRIWVHYSLLTLVHFLYIAARVQRAFRCSWHMNGHGQKFQKRSVLLFYDVLLWHFRLAVMLKRCTRTVSVITNLPIPIRLINDVLISRCLCFGSANSSNSKVVLVHMSSSWIGLRRQWTIRSLPEAVADCEYPTNNWRFENRSSENVSSSVSSTMTVMKTF